MIGQQPATNKPHFVADASVPWTIALDARPVRSVTVAEVQRHLDEVNDALHTARSEVTAGSQSALHVLCADTTDSAVLAHLYADRLTLVAHHRYLDGLSLLSVLGRVTGSTIGSSARGIGQTEAQGLGGNGLRRLREVLFSPPATIAPDSPDLAHAGTPGVGDTFVSTVLPRELPLRVVLPALAPGVATYNAARGGRTRHVHVAIGVSRVPGTNPPLGDNSALLRLTNLEKVPPATLTDLIRATSPEPPVNGETATGWRGQVIGLALRLFARRLGSTVLVSHLGLVQAPGAADLRFYPVTAGGSGVSLGLVTHNGQTSLTARGRAARHSEAALQELLADLVAHLNA